MRLMVSDWMLNWRILLSPGLSLYCLRHWPEGASADAAQRMHNRSFITTCSQKKNPWTAKPFLVELKTSSNGKTRPFALGDSQCAGEGARGDGERLYFFQFCFLKIAVKQKSTLTWKIFRRSCTIQRTSPLKEKMSWPVPALSSQLLLQKSPWPGGVLSRSFTFCDYDASFFWYFAMSSEALDSTPRLEVNLNEEGLVHTRALGLALALLSGVLMTVYSRCPRTRMATFMFSEFWTCHL